MPSARGSIQLLGALLAIGCHRGPKLPEGDIAATLTAPSIAGAFDPASLAGKPSLVLFVTPTCPHCLATIPRAIAAANAETANVVAVFVAGKAQNARGIVDYTHFTGPALVDDGTLTKRYAIDHVPFTLVLGADGHARDAFVGEQDESTLQTALADAR
jgi:thiol-disulfide isomerase/thioredoxin